MLHLLRSVALALMLLTLCTPRPLSAQPAQADLPEAEKKLADTVDPWGIAFSDQFSAYRAPFALKPDAPLAVGYTHALVKIWPNKYWFHGGEVFVAANNTAASHIWGVTGGSVSFQIVVLPRIGAEPADYTIEAKSPVATRVYREEFVDAGPAAYPRFETNVWPDPLIEANTCRLDTTSAGVFLVELDIPADFKDEKLTCAVRVRGAKAGDVAIDVPIRVVKLAIEPKAFPLVAMVSKALIGEAGYRASADMLLKHHLQPLDPEFLVNVWQTQGGEAFEKEVRARMAQGQRVFYISPGDAKLYEFLKAKNWLGNFITQVGPDEPDAATFAAQNVPQVAAFRAKFPGLRVLLATLRHPNLAQGCDIQLNDLSTSTYDPRKFIPGPASEPPEMWHYYCHLPIQATYRAPVVQAPNMQIDNPALEHRVALWMSWHYGARGVFIWSGLSELPAKDFWKNQPLKLEQDRPTFPYGGVHHGNGFLIYPPREPGGAAAPSLRLKVLRDGMEDVAIFEAIRKQARAKAGKDPAWLSPTPEVFQHPHYFDQVPETLLAKREAVLRAYVESGAGK